MFAQNKKGWNSPSTYRPMCRTRSVGDANRLRQILSNLADNAIKFTDQGKVILNIEMESETEKDVCLHFSVVDSGIGIPLSKQQLIFEAFAQADNSTTRKYGGTGLGLSISSRLVQLMSGKIWVESEENRGSAFHFTARFGLQKQQAKEEAPQRGGSSAALSTSRRPLRAGRQELRILLVEDNTINQILVQRMLRKRAWNIVVAITGREALAALESERFDLILMDVQMPEMSGLEVTAAIRGKEKETGEHIPIVATTASVMKEDRQRCFDAGMDAYIAKPIEKEILHETIDKLTGHSSEAGSGDSDARSHDPVFDVGAVLDSLEGDSDLLRDIVVIFLAQFPKHMESIREAISNRDPDLLQRASHALKGAAANLLAQGVVQAASKLEGIGRAGSISGSKKH